jgi:hypothetical protein
VELGRAGAAAVIFDEFFDDATLFPPGEAPAEAAIPAHQHHIGSPYGRCVGPFIVPATRMEEIAALWEQGNYKRPLAVALTFGDGPDALAETLTRATRLDHIRVVSVEIAVPPAFSARKAVSAVEATLPGSVKGFIEVPRDERRHDVIAALSDTVLRAKFRTGGITAAAYPSEGELAEAIAVSVTRGVPFKATAGLHHAVRNIDPQTGFEQHGFLNIIAAVAAALEGAAPADLANILASRNGASLAHTVTALTDHQICDARAQFTSFGTCSIIEPLEDLVQLDLLPASILSTHQGVHA